KEYDAESGNHYFEARHQNWNTGRFLSPDPIHFQTSMLSNPQGFNLYAYVRNNPLRFADPTGESIQLTGDAKSRRKQMNALCEVLQGEGCDYLYEQAVTTTDANGNTTTTY